MEVVDNTELFMGTAKWLFFQNTFIINGKKCRIVEVEFYQTPDPFIHGDLDQLEIGRFYFHRQPTKDGSQGSYKGGTYKGLDITIGQKDRNICGGALIRSILTPVGVIEGPCNVVNFILKETGHDDISSLIDNIFKIGKVLPVNINTEGACLRLVTDKYEESRIYNAPRVGLTLKRETQNMGMYCRHLMKEYRFTWLSGQIKICKYMFIVCARKYGVPDNTIIQDWNISTASGIMSRWVTYFINGKTMSCAQFLQSETKGLSKVSQQLNAYGFFSHNN